MTDSAMLAELLTAMRKHFRATAIRDYALHFGVTGRTVEQVVEALGHELKGDVVRALRRGPWTVQDWNQVLDHLGGRRRRSWDELQTEMLRILASRLGRTEGPAVATGEPAISESKLPERHAQGETNLSFVFDANKASRPARVYQRELVEALIAHCREQKGGQKLLVHVATGGGKTRIANDWVA